MLPGFYQYCGELTYLAQRHNMVPPGIEPRTSQSLPLRHHVPLSWCDNGFPLHNMETFCVCTKCFIIQLILIFYIKLIFHNFMYFEYLL